MDPSEYPDVRRDGTVDVLHGESIPDPYRWLEDPDSEETRAFVTAQNKLTQSVLDRCDGRGAFKERMTKMWNYEKFGVPSRKGDRYIYAHNTGLQNQYVIKSVASVRDDDASAKVVIDPNTLSTDGTVSLGSQAYSYDGSLLAYTLSSGGSDWVEIKVLQLAPDGSVTHLDDHLKHVKFSSLAWTHDGLGFFYNRFDVRGCTYMYMLSLIYTYPALTNTTTRTTMIIHDNRLDIVRWIFGLTPPLPPSLPPSLPLPLPLPLPAL